jgi:hypothetical protein
MLAMLGSLAGSVILLVILMTATGIAQLTAVAGLAIAMGVLPYLCSHTGKPVPMVHPG